MQSGVGPGRLDPAVCEKEIERTSACLREGLFGQDEPIRRLCEVLRTRAAERFLGWDQAVETGCVNWDRRPWACLLAVGPTGTGKTETARRVADLLFDGRLISLNCSEVGPESPHAVSMWTGAPPGYVGHGGGGLLTNDLQRHRNAVILFDEIEKAAAGVVEHVLIPLLGEGTVTDRNNGHTLWATDCVVFCTSNLGTTSAGGLGTNRPGQERQSEQDAQQMIGLLERRFRQEVMARFHDVLRYAELGREAKWQVWSSLERDLAGKIGPKTRFVFDKIANEFLEARFAAGMGGARAIADLFREQVVPLAAGTRQGETVSVTVDAFGRLRRVEDGGGAVCIDDVAGTGDSAPARPRGLRVKLKERA